MRLLESCPYREPALAADGGAEVATCGLLRSITGLEAGSLSMIGRDACSACCAWPEPSADRINPVLASLLTRQAEAVLTAGGLPGCDLERAAALRAEAVRSLQIVPVVRRDTPRKERFLPVGPDKASTAVVIPCHNNGRFLVEAIESVLAQTARPSEIVVVDDASEDETRAVARRYVGAGVRYLRIEARHVFLARAAGFDATAAEFLVFLDADDVLPADYLERGLPFFADPNLGIVYSDYELFGDESGRSVFPEFDPPRLERENYIHAGALVRRRAIEIADAFRPAQVPAYQADWFLWRRIIDSGWRAVKQPALYRYRRHADSMSARRDSVPWSPTAYYEAAALENAEVTIFTPLAGRARLWERYRDWLLAQHWPKSQCHVFLMDTSGDPEFGRTARRFLAEAPYADTRYVARVVAEAGLADRPRRTCADEVRLACARIYNQLAREAATPFILIVEDDIIPPLDVIGQLLRGMDHATSSVTAPYRSRIDGSHVVWGDRGEDVPLGSGYQRIGGSGLGCLLIRRAALSGQTFGFGYAEPSDFDHTLFRRLRKAGWEHKVAWPMLCEHLAANGEPW